jgi:hypothetical protein
MACNEEATYVRNTSGKLEDPNIYQDRKNFDGDDDDDTCDDPLLRAEGDLSFQQIGTFVYFDLIN